MYNIISGFDFPEDRSMKDFVGPDEESQAGNSNAVHLYTTGGEKPMRYREKYQSDESNQQLTYRDQDLELEIAFGHANSANADAQKTIKKYMETVRELTNDRSQASAVAPELPGGMIL
ncbi:hypothetical protein Q1695_004167 [Nippostrongylus brasiliensis]|nr:hypothetical protein Q1695_004167 [Nippostrongylus brasiliensis]